MALAFGGLSFTALKDSSIEVDNHGTKQSLSYSDIKELKSWLENVIYEFHNHPPSYLGGVGVNAQFAEAPLQPARFHNQNPFPGAPINAIAANLERLEQLNAGMELPPNG